MVTDPIEQLMTTFPPMMTLLPIDMFSNPLILHVSAILTFFPTDRMPLLTNSFSVKYDISSELLYFLRRVLLIFVLHYRDINMERPLPSPRFLIYTIAVHVLDYASPGMPKQASRWLEYWVSDSELARRIV